MVVNMQVPRNNAKCSDVCQRSVIINMWFVCAPAALTTIMLARRTLVRKCHVVVRLMSATRKALGAVRWLRQRAIPMQHPLVLQVLLQRRVAESCVYALITG